ncbi:ribose-phosphate pyrophosphokinase [Patescibacteria group bacterium]|nr:ribose-phosphate pyrophosphokinase [Patescibacteria group bacterium]
MKPIILGGTSNPSLATKIAKELNTKLGSLEIERFSDGEIYVNIKEKLKGKEVFIIQSCSNPANEHLMETLLTIDAAKRSKAKKVTVVFPFYPYRRQERQVKPGEAISAELVAKLVEAAGADAVIAANLHSTTIEPFFKIPITHVRLWDIFINYYKKKIGSTHNFVVVAPDAGSMRRSKTIAQGLGIPLVLVEKSRPKHDVVEISNIVGEVENKNIIMIDDEINTADTLLSVAEALQNLGAKDVFFAAVHAVLSGPAIKRIKKPYLKEIAVTDTVRLHKEKQLAKIKVLTAAKEIATAIKKETL